MRRRHINIIAVAVLIFGAALFLLRERILLAAGDFLIVQDTLQPADLIHVIAGPDEQSDYAIQLYQEGYGAKVFFTGGWCRSHNFYHGRHGKERALAHGVPPSAIAIDDSPVTSTYGEVSRLKEFIFESKAPIRSVIAVSDPYHMRRARWTYRQILEDKVGLRMAPVPFKLSPFKRHWWTDHASRMMVADEYTKIGYYLARYQFSCGFMRKWLASLDRD